MDFIAPDRHNATTWVDPDTGEVTRKCKCQADPLPIKAFPQDRRDKAHGRGRKCIVCVRADARAAYAKRKAAGAA